MGRSFGAGQPCWFKCPIARKTTRQLGIHTKNGKNYQLTGRRRTSFSRFTGGGLRSDPDFVYQFKCLDCGHVGWSRHIDIARRFQREFLQCKTEPSSTQSSSPASSQPLAGAELPIASSEPLNSLQVSARFRAQLPAGRRRKASR